MYFWIRLEKREDFFLNQRLNKFEKGYQQLIIDLNKSLKICQILFYSKWHRNNIQIYRDSQDKQ